MAGTCGHATESSDLTKDLQFLSSLMSVKRCTKEDFAACSTELIRHSAVTNKKVYLSATDLDPYNLKDLSYILVTNLQTILTLSGAGIA